MRRDAIAITRNSHTWLDDPDRFARSPRQGGASSVTTNLSNNRAHFTADLQTVFVEVSRYFSS
jgi:hypothetical protein